MNSDYQYDIFVSYRRHDTDWVRWTRENFAGSIRSLLAPKLTRTVEVFIDEQIEPGAPWPDYLAGALARSRVLVPLLSRNYFCSPWCRLEFSLMYQREQQLRTQYPKAPWRLIFPFVIDDGDSFPIAARKIQCVGIHSFANPIWPAGTVRHAQLAEVIRPCCEEIARALAQGPRFDPGWEQLTQEGMDTLFETQVRQQVRVPGLSLTGSDG